MIRVSGLQAAAGMQAERACRAGCAAGPAAAAASTHLAMVPGASAGPAVEAVRRVRPQKALRERAERAVAVVNKAWRCLALLGTQFGGCGTRPNVLKHYAESIKTSGRRFDVKMRPIDGQMHAPRG